MSRQDQCSKDCELLVRKIVDVRQLYVKLCKGCSMHSHGGFNEVHWEWHWHCKRAASELWDWELVVHGAQSHSALLQIKSHTRGGIDVAP